MRILKKNALSFAIINPNLPEKADGQYKKFKMSDPGAEDAIAAARNSNFEIRYYYGDMTNCQDENIPLKVVITEIPPNSKQPQPWHRHVKNYEIHILNKGSLTVRESTATTVEDINDNNTVNITLEEGDAAILNPVYLHTVKNKDPKAYSQFTTILTPRINSRRVENDR